MDTRKLIAHIDGDSGDEGRIEQAGYGIIGGLVGAQAVDILPQIVSRWNAHPEMIRALKAVAASRSMQDADPNTHAIVVDVLNSI